MDHPFETARDATLAALTEFARTDPRIEALWLQGSLAAGQADAFSDIDAYLAVADAAFEEVWSERGALLGRLGGALAWSAATTPGLTAVHALMTGGARLDLFFEKASAAPDTPRPIAKALVDKTGLAARLKLDWRAPVPVIAQIVQTIIRMTRQGATWPLRVLGRGQWSTLAMMELDLINGQLAQLMAVRHDPANFYKNPFSVQMVLTPQERERLAQLTAEALAALAVRDAAALKAVHLRVLDALVAEGRAACAALGVEYPIAEAAERDVRALLERSWPA
jgi:lincosamide nucleotidyltransferase B/F